MSGTGHAFNTKRNRLRSTSDNTSSLFNIAKAWAAVGMADAAAAAAAAAADDVAELRPIDPEVDDDPVNCPTRGDAATVGVALAGVVAAAAAAAADGEACLCLLRRCERASCRCQFDSNDLYSR